MCGLMLRAVETQMQNWHQHLFGQHAGEGAEERPTSSQGAIIVIHSFWVRHGIEWFQWGELDHP